jgi:hypothetical protein
MISSPSKIILRLPACLLQSRCASRGHIEGKNLRSQGAEDYNTDNLLPDAFSSSLLRSRLGWHLLLACHIEGKNLRSQGAEDHNTDNPLSFVFSSLQQSHVPTDAYLDSSCRKHSGETSHRAHKLEPLNPETITKKAAEVYR